MDNSIEGIVDFLEKHNFFNIEHIWRGRTFSAYDRNGERVFIKETSSDPTIFKRNDILYNLGLQPSKPLLYLTEKEDQKKGYLISEFIDLTGLDNLDKAKVNALSPYLAKMLAIVHDKLEKNQDSLKFLFQKRAVPFEKTAGRFNADFKDAKIDTDNPEILLASQIASANRNLNYSAKEHNFIIHDDMWLPNIILCENKHIINTNETLGLIPIDYDLLRTGHPALDVARLATDLKRFIKDDFKIDDFWDNYLDERKYLGGNITDFEILKSDAFFSMAIERVTSHTKLRNNFPKINFAEQTEIILGLIETAMTFKPALQNDLPDLIHRIKEKDLEKNGLLGLPELVMEAVNTLENKKTNPEQIPEIFTRNIKHPKYKKNTSFDPSKKTNLNKYIPRISKIFKNVKKVAMWLITAYLGVTSVHAGITTAHLSEKSHIPPANLICSNQIDSELNETKPYEFVREYPEELLLKQNLNRLISNAYRTTNINYAFNNFEEKLEEEVIMYFADMNIEQKQAKEYFKAFEKESIVKDFCEMKYLIKEELKLSYDMFSDSIMNLEHLEDSEGKSMDTPEERSQYIEQTFRNYLTKALKKGKK